MTVIPGPPPVVDAGVQAVTWTGWDGREWDLLGGAQNARLVQGVQGVFEGPGFDRFTKTGQLVPGSMWRGYRVQERRVFLPCVVWAEGGSGEFWTVRRDFLSSFRPDLTGRLAVRTQLGTRTLACRLAEDKTPAVGLDPSLVRAQVVGLDLVAEQPLWQGETVQSPVWTQPVASRAFFPGPPFQLGKSFTSDKASVVNPGDEPAYPKWTLTGPLAAGATVGVGGKTLTVPFALLAGQSLTVDADPTHLSIVDQAGTSRFPDLNGRLVLPPIPGLGRSDLTVTISGAGSVQAEFTPLYYRGAP